MARTAVAYSNLAANSSLADPAGTTIDATNHHVVNASEPERTVIRVTNTAAATKVITVKAGDSPPAWSAGQGDLTYTLGIGNVTTTVVWLGPFESGRFVQSNGTIEVDIASGHTGTITAFLLPKGV